MNFILLASVYDILNNVESFLLKLKTKTKTKFILLESINENANHGELLTKLRTETKAKFIFLASTYDTAIKLS